LFIRFLLSTLSVGIILAFAPNAKAIPVYFGTPVESLGSSTQAVPTCPSLEGASCYNSQTGEIKFFIPLSSTYSGVYGVTSVPGGTAGTVSDIGSGLQNSLTMYLRFEPINLSSTNASLEFVFTDLDLSGVNDPFGFTETIQFFDSQGNSFTSPINLFNQQPGSGELPYSISGDSYSQTILFSNISPIVSGNLVPDPFFVKLSLGSQFYTNGRNTPEFLTARLASVPEPATLLLMGSGLLAFGLLRKK